MKIIRVSLRFFLVLGIGCGCWLVLRARAADVPGPLPPVIRAGFDLWASGGGMESVLNLWQKGGMTESDSRVASQANFLRAVNQAAGDYRSYEVLQSKLLGRKSQVVYFAMYYERGAVYARFLFYRTEKNWVVQSMDFSTRPEALLPWLAYEGDRNAG
ncbi:MAG: hypothetical protein ACLQM8_02460 [Limisphaerales bacterium]